MPDIHLLLQQFISTKNSLLHTDVLSEMVQ